MSPAFCSHVLMKYCFEEENIQCEAQNLSLP